MIAAASGARVVAVDVSPDARELARRLGAAATVDAAALPGAARVAAAVGELTGGGAHLSLDALGSPETCVASILSLRHRGRHVQVGLMPPARGYPAVPMDRVIAYELALLGSHGMPAYAYPEMLGMVAGGALPLERLVTRTIDLAGVAPALASMGGSTGAAGVTIITP